MIEMKMWNNLDPERTWFSYPVVESVWKFFIVDIFIQCLKIFFKYFQYFDILYMDSL